jgi:dGTP triphosphohydrolase
MIKLYVKKTIEGAEKNIKKFKIKTYDDVKRRAKVKTKEGKIINWDNTFEKLDKKFVKEFLRPGFYCHHEIKRMDSRAEFFLRKLFCAFHKNPKQLPKRTYNNFINSIKEDLKGFKYFDGKNYSAKIDQFLNSDDLECGEGCTYIPQAKYPTDSQIINSHCPLLKIKGSKRACKGIRVIINHIAGMTDRYAHLEYSRLYFPPEISGM